MLLMSSLSLFPEGAVRYYKKSPNEQKPESFMPKTVLEQTYTDSFEEAESSLYDSD